MCNIQHSCLENVHVKIPSCVLLQMYSHEFKAVLDGVETDSLMEINSAKRMEIFRLGNSTDEVVEVHDFQNVSINL